MAVGFTILGALMIMLLSRLVELNIPIIGNVLAQITRIVLERL